MDKITFQYTKPIASDYAIQSQKVLENDRGRRLLREQVGDLDRSSVLVDMGCGSGLDLMNYSNMGFQRLIGVEPSQNFCSMASQLLGDRAAVISGTFQNIPLAGQSVDALMSRYSLHYCQNLSAAIKESSRVLRAGGLFAAIVGHPDYDQKAPRNEDGTISYTLYGGKVPITYFAHPMEAYIGEEFQKHFSIVRTIQYVSDNLDGAGPLEPSALCIVATRKCGPVP